MAVENVVLHESMVFMLLTSLFTTITTPSCQNKQGSSGSWIISTCSLQKMYIRENLKQHTSYVESMCASHYGLQQLGLVNPFFMR